MYPFCPSRIFVIRIYRAFLSNSTSFSPEATFFSKFRPRSAPNIFMSSHKPRSAPFFESRRLCIISSIFALSVHSGSCFLSCSAPALRSTVLILDISIPFASLPLALITESRDISDPFDFMITLGFHV